MHNIPQKEIRGVLMNRVCQLGFVNVACLDVSGQRDY